MPGRLGGATASCNNGDVAVGGNYGVNGVNFLVYFAGTEIIPDNIGSPTENAASYFVEAENNNPAGGPNIRIFAVAYCLPVQ